MAISEIPSLHLKAVAYKTNRLYLKLPEGSIGNMTFARTSIATRVNKEGLVEEVATGIPRLDYPLINGVVQSCPELLLEPTSTNLTLWSEDLSNVYWTKNNLTANFNSVISPDGTLNATNIIGDTSAQILSPSITLTENIDYTLSLSLKGTGSVTIRIQENGGDFTNYVTTSVNITNEWIRYSITGLKEVDGNPARIVIESISNLESVDIYGIQLEALSYATSYIKTEGSTETRATENLIDAGDATTFNDDEGVIYFHSKATDEATIVRILSLNDGSGNLDNHLFFRYNSPTQVRWGATSGGVSSVDSTYNALDTTIFHKFAIRYSNNNFSLWIDGIKVQEDLSGNTPIGLNTFSFQRSNNTLPFFSRIEEVKVYKTALTDSEMEELMT